MACGAPHVIEANGLRLRLHEWGEPGRPPALLLHSLAAHSHWWDWSGPLLARRSRESFLTLTAGARMLGHFSTSPAWRATWILP
jgi:pimeloyl-ACP methyl ester carboxylesterase